MSHDEKLLQKALFERLSQRNLLPLYYYKFKIGYTWTMRAFHKLDLKEGLDVLDVGGGAMPCSFLFAPLHDIQLVVVDISPSSLRRALENKVILQASGSIDVIVADAENLPFRPESFHTVVCSMVLEHLPNPERAISQMSQVLKERGNLFVLTVCRQWPLRFFWRAFFPLSPGHEEDKFFTFVGLRRMIDGNNMVVRYMHSTYCLFSAFSDLFLIPLLGPVSHETGFLTSVLRVLERIAGVVDLPLIKRGIGGTVLAVATKYNEKRVGNEEGCNVYS